MILRSFHTLTVSFSSRFYKSIFSAVKLNPFNTITLFKCLAMFPYCQMGKMSSRKPQDCMPKTHESGSCAGFC